MKTSSLKIVFFICVMLLGINTPPCMPKILQLLSKEASLFFLIRQKLRSTKTFMAILQSILAPVSMVAIWVGEKSPIPNTDGIRNDVVNALRDISIPNLRWPGGCFADTYHWKDGIGPKDKRPSIINTNWGGVTEDNSFGTHEFMRFENCWAVMHISMEISEAVLFRRCRNGLNISLRQMKVR